MQMILMLEILWGGHKEKVIKIDLIVVWVVATYYLKRDYACSLLTDPFCTGVQKLAQVFPLPFANLHGILIISLLYDVLCIL